MTKYITALLALVATLAFIPAAGAQVPQQQNRIDARRFAVSYWRDYQGEWNPCEGQIRLQFYPFSLTGDYDKWGYTYNNSCTVYMNSDRKWNWWKLCAVATHEIGHVFGHQHHRYDPWSIMYPTYPAIDEYGDGYGWRFHDACDYS